MSQDRGEVALRSGMRADVPSAVSAAFDRCARPTLVFDTERIAHNLATLAKAASRHGVTALFAAKSFPHPEVWGLAARSLAGFDAASASELATLPATAVTSVFDPTGVAASDVPRGGRLIVGCETIAQVERAPRHAEIAIRVSASVTGTDPAVGAVLDGSGHRRSRFGLDGTTAEMRAQLRDMLALASGRRVGLHLHHGPVTATSPERFVASARALMAIAEVGDVTPAFLNLGGAWHGIDDLDAALETVRAAIPRSIEVIVEPGRAVTREAGFACGRVAVEREIGDRGLRVVDLSRLCHLRWSPIDLVGRAPGSGDGARVLVVGPTCFEDDVLGDWVVPRGSLKCDERVVFRHVSGYAVAWNSGFAGVPPAGVLLV